METKQEKTAAPTESVAVFPEGTRVFFGTNFDTKEPMLVLQYKGNICAFTYGVILEAAELVCNELEKDCAISSHLKATKEIN